jgi:hypothetical protein
MCSARACDDDRAGPSGGAGAGWRGDVVWRREVSDVEEAP